MKILSPYPVSRRSRQDGSAVIVIMVLLAMMLIYVGANLKTLHALQRELKLIEIRQVQRVQARAVAPSQGNTVSTNAALAKMPAVARETL